MAGSIRQIATSVGQNVTPGSWNTLATYSPSDAGIVRLYVHLFSFTSGNGTVLFRIRIGTRTVVESATDSTFRDIRKMGEILVGSWWVLGPITSSESITVQTNHANAGRASMELEGLYQVL